MECGSYNTRREGEEGVPVAAVPLPQASHAQQDDEEWETEHDEEIVGGHERDMTPCENQEFVFANNFDGMLEKSLNFVIF